MQRRQSSQTENDMQVAIKAFRETRSHVADLSAVSHSFHLACVNVAGSSIPPMPIFKGKKCRSDFQTAFQTVNL
jgi:hypothetical protein